MTGSSHNLLMVKVTSAGLVTALSTVTAATITLKSESTLTTSAPLPSEPQCTPTGSGVCRYVDPAGSDPNPGGTSGRPFHTLQQAAGGVKPGDVVIARNGIYTG